MPKNSSAPSGVTEHAVSGRGSSAVARSAKRITLKDVAAAAGVSLTTASFVLTGREDQRIAESTQVKVREVADRLGYRPNLTARVLRTGTSGTIALISDFISTTGYAGGFVRGALEAARQHGSLLYIAETLGDPQIERELLQGMLDRRVDGFVYASLFTHEVALPELLVGQAVVLLNCTTKDSAIPTVVPDEVKAGSTAVGALLDAGHRRGIYFVGELDHDPPASRWGAAARTPTASRDRLAGITAELKRRKARLEASVNLDDWSPEEGRRAVRELLATGGPVSAIICANDRVALGAYQALAEAGLAVPSDVSIVSFDDSELAAWLQPALTSVAIPHEALGRHAIDTLVSARQRIKPSLIPMPLVSRASIGEPVRR